jgi:hypothetical protein
LLSLKKHEITLDENGEVDFSKCENEKIVKKLKTKLPMVKEALLLDQIDFGMVHTQNRRNKAREIENMIMEVSEKETELNEKILEKLKTLTLQKYEDVNLSNIDKEIGTHIHTLSAQPISKEDLYYEQATMDLENFMSGEYHCLC